MRSRFDEQLALLNKELIEMGALCEEAIRVSTDALSRKDNAEAEKVPPISAEIDRKERAIESLCLKLLLQQQPVASDLRQISAALKMITDMERIGDQAQDIAENVCFLDGKLSKGDELLAVLEDMAKAAMQMVTSSVDAYVKRDVAGASLVIESDDIVDAYFLRIKTMLTNQIAKDPEEGEFAIDLLMIAKYLERIGDHAVNIAKWVIFSITGVHEKG